MKPNDIPLLSETVTFPPLPANVRLPASIASESAPARAAP